MTNLGIKEARNPACVCRMYTCIPKENWIRKITTKGAFIDYGFEETMVISITYRLEACHYINLLITLYGLPPQMHISLSNSNVKDLGHNKY